MQGERLMEKHEWQGSAGETWAREWRRTDRSFTAVTEKLLRTTRSFSFDKVLDIGCGAGELSLAIARGRPHCQVIGVDVSPDLVKAARERGASHRNLSFELGDAARWSPPAGFAPELLVSRHGVMFFEDPPAAFANLADLAAVGAHILFSCFRSPAENPFFTEVARLLPAPSTPPPPGSPGPFAFADKERVKQILTAGGWTGVMIESFDFAMVTGAGDDPVADTVDYFSSIGPAAAIAREMSEPARLEFFDKIRNLARNHLSEGIVSLPAAGWIVVAKKA
jgi:SAM-dependent methyltransferase